MITDGQWLKIARPRMWERMLVRADIMGDRLRLCAPSVTQPAGNVMFDGTLALFEACCDRGMFTIESPQGDAP